jgi:hypothetical protein
LTLLGWDCSTITACSNTPPLPQYRPYHATDGCNFVEIHKPMNNTLTLVPMLALFGNTLLQAQWEQVGPVGSAYGIVVQNGSVFAGLQYNGVRRSMDHGATWALADSGITEPSNWWLSSVDGVLYCGTQGVASFRSNDEGVSWQNIGLNAARGFEEHLDTLYSCQWYSATVQWSVDQGETWHSTAPLPAGSGGLWPLISHQGKLLVGGQGGGIYRMVHSAAPWISSNTGLDGTNCYAFAAMGDLLFAGMADGVFRSDDGGATWTPSGLEDSLIYSLHAKDSLLLAGCGYHGVMLSLDSGASWTPFNEGLTSFQVARITSDDEYYFAGMLGAGVFRRSIIESNAVHEEADDAIQVVAAPNPLQDATEFRLRLKHAAEVTLQITDVTGARLATVQHGKLLPGPHTLPWDASSMAPGTYLWQLTAGHLRQCGKLLVTK